MGYHVVFPGEPGGQDLPHPVIKKDGGTGEWRQAKKLVRQWYLDQAAAMRKVSEKSYFEDFNKQE